MSDLCAKTELPRLACAHCRLTGSHLAKSVEESTSSRPFLARYESTCGECGFDINLEDRVRFVNDRLIHADNRGCDL